MSPEHGQPLTPANPADPARPASCRFRDPGLPLPFEEFFPQHHALQGRPRDDARRSWSERIRELRPRAGPSRGPPASGWSCTRSSRSRWPASCSACWAWASRWAARRRRARRPSASRSRSSSSTTCSSGWASRPATPGMLPPFDRHVGRQRGAGRHRGGCCSCSTTARPPSTRSTRALPAAPALRRAGPRQRRRAPPGARPAPPGARPAVVRARAAALLPAFRPSSTATSPRSYLAHPRAGRRRASGSIFVLVRVPGPVRRHPPAPGEGRGGAPLLRLPRARRRAPLILRWRCWSRPSPRSASWRAATRSRP